MRRSTAYATETEPIRTDALYPLATVPRVTGISETRINEARRGGVDLETLDVGRRKYVHGAKLIAYIEALAQLESAKRAAAGAAACA